MIFAPCSFAFIGISAAGKTSALVQGRNMTARESELAALLGKAVEYIESEFAYPGWEEKFGEPNPTYQFVKKCYEAIESSGQKKENA